MRLFIALSLPEDVRRQVREASEPLRKTDLPVRWIDPDRYHLTLKFLGTVGSERIPVVEKVMRRVASETPPFPLMLRGFGAFPTIRRPRVIWLGAEPSPALRCLKQDLEWAFANHGFERETRAFHPHLTLGRVDGDAGAGVFRGLDELAAEIGFSVSIEAEHIDLMRTHLSRESARYSVVSEVPLRVPQPRA